MESGQGEHGADSPKPAADLGGVGTAARWIVGAIGLMVGGSSLLCGLLFPFVLVLSGGPEDRSLTERIVVGLLVLAFLGASAVGGALIARWAFARRVIAVVRPPSDPDADDERAIIALAAKTRAPLSEAEIVLQTSLSLVQVRAALDRMRRHGVVELVLSDSQEALAYQVVGLSSPRATSAHEPPETGAAGLAPTSDLPRPGRDRTRSS